MSKRRGPAKPSLTGTAALDREVAGIRSSVENSSLVAANRRLLVETTTRLFRQRGYHNTSTRDIAIASGMSVGALYQYIRRKEDIMILILQSVIQIYAERIYPLADSIAPARERLAQAIDVYYRILDEHHAKTDLLYHEFAGLGTETKRYLSESEDIVFTFMQSILQQGIDDASFMPVDTRFMAHNIVSMGHMWALKRVRFKSAMSIDGYIREQQRYTEMILLAGKDPAGPTPTADLLRSSTTA